MKKERNNIFGIQRNLFFTGITSFFTDTTTKMIYSVMPLFLLSLGAGKTEISLIEGIAESTASLLKAVSGWWGDKIGRNKPFMIIGYAFTAVLSPLFAFVYSPLQVLIIRFTERVGKGIRTAPRDSLVAASSEKGKRGRGFGFHKAMDNCGAIAGPLIAFAILSAFPSDYRRVFLFAAIPGILGIATLIIFVKEAKKNKESLPNKISARDFPKRYYFFLFIIFIFTLGNSTDALLLIKASDVGIANEFIPIMYLIFNSVSVVFSIPAGVLSDKIGREKLILFGYLLYSSIYFAFGKSSTGAAVILLFALYGLYSAATDGVQKALVSDIIQDNKRGTALGIYNCIIGVTLLPASVIAGALYEKINYSAPFYFGSAMAFAAFLLMALFYIINKNKLIN
ncbi:MAG: MFS transporter [Eubacteriaceae bacterium]|nr:MFS transporter [Eubacteriaceae bacterium]